MARTLPELLEAVREFAAVNLPGLVPDRITLHFANGQPLGVPIPPAPLPLARPVEEPVFVPTAYQLAILEALDGRALRTDALAAETGDRSRLFRHPGGLKELREAGLVDHHDRLGYYRTDAPPPELAPSQGTASFAPNDYQLSILDALEGSALRADDLGADLGDRRRLYRHPGGLRELRDQGLVRHHPRLGYFRPDAPPPELQEER